MTILRGHVIDVLPTITEPIDLVVTDPPYAFDGRGEEHALTAAVAVGLRESAKLLRPGRFMLVFCAASWRSQAYMVESLRGVLTPVRTGTWCKPKSRTKTRTPGWAWASVSVVVFRNGKAADVILSSDQVDHITAAPVIVGRRAQIPTEVASWAVSPFCIPGGLMLDPFCGSGALLTAAESTGMRSVGIESQDR